MEHGSIFVFTWTQLKELAIFVSQLIREGVTFEVRQNNASFEVKLTGGF